MQFLAVLCILLCARNSVGFLKTSVARNSILKTSFSHDLDKSVRSNEVVAAGKVEEAGHFSQSMMDQKNQLLVQLFYGDGDPEMNITNVAEEHVNFCDESFNVFLNKKIADIPLEKDKAFLGKVRYEINSARQRKLRNADQILREILAAGGLKQMEAKLAYYLARADIDMAFMVILQLNIEDAASSGAERAAQVMTHLNTLILEHQDTIVSAPVRLVRMLVREEDSMVRKQMLRQKLLVGDNMLKDSVSEIADLLAVNSTKDSEQDGQAKDTTVPQCEHIVVQAVKSWGGADVTVAELEDTLADVLSQMQASGSTGLPHESDIETLCANIRTDIGEVLLELETPKISDQCD